MRSQNGRSYRNRIDKLSVVQCIIFSVLLLICALFQVSFFKVMGAVPAIVLCFICGIGFICGERVGGVCGIIGGFFIDILGGAGICISPLTFMLAGFGCGFFLSIFLRKNFLSFIIYSSVAGLIKMCITLAYFALKSNSFNIIQIFSKTLFPEFFGFLLFVPVSYFVCVGINKLTVKIFGKNQKT